MDRMQIDHADRMRKGRDATAPALILGESPSRPVPPRPVGHAAIRQWPEGDRPRERLLAHGPGALADAELLALILGSGNEGVSAVEQARRLIASTGSLSALLCATPQRLQRERGVGPARTAALLAIVELASRVQRECIDRSTVVDRPEAVRAFLGLQLRGQARELFAVLFLDTQNRLIRYDELFGGTLNQTAVYPREVARRALELNAAAVILAHNHPSGVAEPSHADRALTQSLMRTLETIDVRVLDHLIVAGHVCYSFAEQGLLR